MDEQESIPTMKINYDPKSDVFYCSFGDPREAVGIETEDEGIVLRVDPENEDIIGVTVLDFSKRFKDHSSNSLTFPLNKNIAALLNCRGRQ
jgi:uncharacterized protein YuzE